MDYLSPDFNLQNTDFDHASRLHGVMHTYRVMCHVLVLGKMIEEARTKEIAFCAALIHDLSRRHDGICLKHGPRAASEKLPLYEDKFSRQGILEFEMAGIARAVAAHSMKTEVPVNDPWYAVCVLLKDADALDRLRLGVHRLDRAYLRLPHTQAMIPYAQKLLDATANMKNCLFNDVVMIADQILGYSII